MKFFEEVFKEESLVSFSDFFRTEEDCKQFLAEYKWAKGYFCRKCKHTKYQLRKNLSRTCNLCGDTESPTANTVFHKVKFGLRKAFFISFQYFKHKELDITDVSKSYAIRPTTAELFIRKLNQIHCLNIHCSCH